MPVEDELVLAADEIAEREVRARVPRPRDEHLLTLLRLADVERRCGEVHEELRTGEGEIGRRWAGLPDVFADRQARVHVARVEHHEVAPLGEVAVLVEDAVVREEVLSVDGAHLAVGAHCARVREISVEPGSADKGDEVGCGARDLLHGIVGGADEAGTEQEILRRVAGDGELREEDEVGPHTARLAEPGEDLLAIPVEVADDDVELGEREPHAPILVVRPWDAKEGFRLIGTNRSLARSAWAKVERRDGDHPRPALPRAAHVGQRRVHVRPAGGVRRRAGGQGHAAPPAPARPAAHRLRRGRSVAPPRPCRARRGGEAGEPRARSSRRRGRGSGGSGAGDAPARLQPRV